MKSSFLALLLLGNCSAAFAQQPAMPGMKMPADTAHQKLAGMPSMGGMPMDSAGGMMGMRNSFSKNLPMTRQGSGTSWHPDNSPMYMKMYQPGGWNVMLM